MKKYLVYLALFIICTPARADIIKTYRKLVQSRIDNNQSVRIGEFADFLDKISVQWEQSQGVQATGKKVVDFLRGIKLFDSTIHTGVIPEYRESYAIEAKAFIGNQFIPIRFLMVQQVKRAPYYALAFKLPDDLRISSFASNYIAAFDDYFANRWIAFSLFDYTDNVVNASIKIGLNIVGDLKNGGGKVSVFKEFVQSIANGFDKPIRCSGLVGLTIFDLFSYFVSGQVPTSVRAMQSVAGPVQLRADIPIAKDIYASQQKDAVGIQNISLDSISLSAQLGVRPNVGPGYLALAPNFGMRIESALRVNILESQDVLSKLLMRGWIDLLSTGVVVNGVMDGDWRKPFGIRWLSLRNFGVEVPLSYLGLFTGGLGLRGAIGFGKTIIDLASKVSIGAVNKTALVMSGKIKNLSFSDIVSGIAPSAGQSIELPPLQLIDGELTLALGDTIIAGREYKKELVVFADVAFGNQEPRSNFSLSITDDGTNYIFAGKGFMPAIQSNYFTFDGAGPDGKVGNQDDGPQFEFEYAFDPLLKSFPLAQAEAKGRMRIGSLFQGALDIKLDNASMIASFITGSQEGRLAAMLRDQRIDIAGKLFDRIGARISILDTMPNDVQLGIELEQQLVSAWEKEIRNFLIQTRQKAEESMAALDEKIRTIGDIAQSESQKYKENVAVLVQDIEVLKAQRDAAIEQCKQAPWYQKYKCAYVAWLQASILSYENLLNETIMGGTSFETAAVGAQKLADLQVLRTITQRTIGTLARMLEGGAIMLGIEKIAARASANQLAQGNTNVLVDVHMKVLGKNRLLSGISIDLKKPLQNIQNVMTHIKNIVDDDPFNKQLIPVLSDMQKETIEDHYAVLGLDPNTSWGSIKKRYKQLLLEWHPDRVNYVAKQMSERQATARYITILQAYAAIKAQKEPSQTADQHISDID